jgi:hypothetical protein
MRLATTRWARQVSRAVVVAASLLAASQGAARAGRSPFGWVRGTEVLPERGVEIETWIFEENGVGNDDEPDITPDETTVWWQTVIGITDRIELAIPIEFRHLQLGESDETLLYAAGVEGRWRFTTSDPVEAGPVAPVLRLGVHRLINARRKTRGEAGFALGIDLGERVHAGIDVGASWVWSRDESEFELTPAGGLSVRLVDELRAGAEVYAEVTLEGTDEDWVAAGPNLAWTHGRFWLSGSMLIGIREITAAPRVNWGVAF